MLLTTIITRLSRERVVADAPAERRRPIQVGRLRDAPLSDNGEDRRAWQASRMVQRTFNQSLLCAVHRATEAFGCPREFRKVRGALPLLAIFISSCGSEKPQYVASTCDFMADPARYAGRELEITGTVIRLKSGSWQFETYCDGSVRSPLQWASGVQPPADVGDLTPTGNRTVSERDTVAGQLMKDGHGGWIVEATRYFKARFIK